MPNQNKRLWWGKLFIIILLFGLFSTQVNAASFDCKKATTWVEKAVCSSPELSKLDDQLAKAYQDALASLSPEGQKETKQYQRQWIKKIYSSCEARDDSTVKCLKNTYETRIKKLQQILIKFPDRIFRKVSIDDSKIDKTCAHNVYVPKELMYPQIENPRDKNEKFWNNLISQKAIDRFKGREECTDIYSGYHISFSNRHLISYENSDYVYEHGAPHGYTNGDCSNWLLEDRRELQLVDLFDNKTDWRNKLAALITQKKKEQEATDTSHSRYTAPGEDLESGLIDIDKITPGDWLISKEKDGLAFLLLSWNLRNYVLVTIDWKTLDPYLSKNGRALIYD